MKRYLTDAQFNLKEDSFDFTELKGWVPQQLIVSEKIKYQNVLGLGGALTESAAYVWSKMSPENQSKIIDLYFSKENSAYNFCRLHIQSCDFALGNYAYVTDPNDRNLKTFSIENDKKYIIPFVKAAIEKNADIEFLASPWSPAPFMKSNGEMNNGGKLLPEYFEMWARLMARYVKTYRDLGINIKRITVQNEPQAVQTWDSCIYTAEEERHFACKYLKKALKSEGVGDVKINIWDHNKEILIERASETLGTKEALKKIDGIAFHWYSGDYFEAVQEVAKRFPDKELIFSEGCVEYSVDKDGSQISRAERYAHDMIGNFNGGMNGFIDWNIVLDSKGGPNHVGNFCDAPIMCDYDSDTFEIHKSYYYIRHFSQFVKKGAKRIYAGRANDKVECTAFENPDGTKVLVILNKSDSDQSVNLSHNGNLAVLDAPKHSIQTVIW